MRQFSLFAWTHVALLIVVTQSYLIIQNMFEGLGMISHKKLLITIFGNKHEIKNFIKKFDIFH